MNAYQTYRQMQTQTAAPGELVLMLYRCARRFLTASIEAIDHHDIAAAHNSLVKAQAIVSELLPAWEAAVREAGMTRAGGLVSAAR